MSGAPFKMKGYSYPGKSPVKSHKPGHVELVAHKDYSGPVAYKEDSRPSKPVPGKQVDKPGTVVSRIAKKVGKHVKGHVKEAIRQLKDESVFTKEGRSYQKDVNLERKSQKATDKYYKKMTKLEKKKELHEVRKKYRR